MNGILFAMILAVQSIGAQSGTVSGQILFTNGMPGSGVRVGAWSLTETLDRASPALIVSTQTDVQGRYQLEAIPPGSYYIGAGRVDGPTYFPGVTASSSKTTVTVSKGATMKGFDFVIVAPLKVSGKIVGSNGQPRDSDGIRILAGRSATRIRLMNESGKEVMSTGITPDGAFEFKDVPPGTYSISSFPSGLALPTLQIVVTDKDILGIKLGLRN